MMRHYNNTGFSFIEILIVLAIVAGIVTLVLRQSDSAVDRSLMQKYYVDIDELRAAAGQYRVQNNTYRGISMRELFDAGVLPDRFAFDDDGNSRISSGNGLRSEGSSPLGTVWTISPYVGGQAFVLETHLGSRGDTARLARQLSHHVNGDSGNCVGVQRVGNEVTGCRVDGQPWADTTRNWQYVVED